MAQLGDGHLEQILDNLLANALDVLPAGKNVTVTAGPVAGMGACPTAAAGRGATAVEPHRRVVRVTVSDNGRGMSEQQQRAAFRRFASGTAGGTGLGLAIVDRLAVANGGRRHCRTSGRAASP